VGLRGAPALFPSGVILDRFEVLSVLGIGGTGTVFRAFDRERGHEVAVKAVPQDATLRQRARREASVGARLEHPHVVELLDLLEDDEYVYVISQLVDGGDLAAALRDRALGDSARLRVLAAVCDALAHAHARGVVHRDVKPANVLLGRDGTVKLADFGIAALADPDATVDDRLLGTLSYMAPEACRGQRPAAPADVWAAGVLVYEALSGANPFRARTPDELLERHAAKARPLGEVRSDLPKGLVAACMRALSANPRRRPTALALRDALQAAVVQVEERAADAPAKPVKKARLAKPKETPEQPPSNVISLRTLPKPQRRSARDVGARVATAFGAGAHGIAAAHVPSDVLQRAQAVAVRLGPAVLAGGAMLAVTHVMPFWPPSFVPALVAFAALLGLLAPWPAAALVVAAALPVLGNLSSGLAWSVGLLAAVWLVACAGAGRRALLPALAPLAAATLAWPAYLVAAGRTRGHLARALTGAAGALVAALWHAGPTAAVPLTGAADTTAVARHLASAGGAPLLAQMLVWAAAAVAWPLVLRVRPRFRAVALALWLGLLMAGQALLPALAGRPVEPLYASVAAPWLLGIVIFLATDLRGQARQEV
jgi:eukaryotic-like serine/threonine-protein kinase